LKNEILSFLGQQLKQLKQLCVWAINASFAQKMQSLKRGELHQFCRQHFISSGDSDGCCIGI